MEHELEKFAATVAQSEQRRVPIIQRHILNLKAAIAQKRADIKAATNAIKRAANYRIVRPGHYHCPRCWVTSGKRSVLEAHLGTSTYECPTCHERFGT